MNAAAACRAESYRCQPGRRPPTACRKRAGEPSNFDALAAPVDDVTDTSAVDAVLKVSGCEQRRRRVYDDAELHRGEQRFPERDLVAEHQQQAVASSCAEIVQEVGDAIRAARQFRERANRLRSVLFDDVQRGRSLPAGDRVEVVERPCFTMKSRAATNERRRACSS